MTLKVTAKQQWMHTRVQEICRVLLVWLRPYQVSDTLVVLSIIHICSQHGFSAVGGRLHLVPGLYVDDYLPDQLNPTRACGQHGIPAPQPLQAVCNLLPQ